MSSVRVSQRSLTRCFACLASIWLATLGGCASNESFAVPTETTELRCEDCEAVWPDAREALYLLLDGNEHPHAFTVEVRNEMIRYELILADGTRDERILVTELSTVTMEGASRRWMRRFTVDGLASGCEVVVAVPLRDRAGRALAVFVNGAAVDAPRQSDALRVSLARDEATEIIVELPAVSRGPIAPVESSRTSVTIPLPCTIRGNALSIS